MKQPQEDKHRVKNRITFCATTSSAESAWIPVCVTRGRRQRGDRTRSPFRRASSPENVLLKAREAVERQIADLDRKFHDVTAVNVHRNLKQLLHVRLGLVSRAPFV